MNKEELKALIKELGITYPTLEKHTGKDVRWFKNHFNYTKYKMTEGKINLILDGIESYHKEIGEVLTKINKSK